MKIIDVRYYDQLPDVRVLIVSTMPEAVSEDVRVFWTDAEGISAEQRMDKRIAEKYRITGRTAT